MSENFYTFKDLYEFLQMYEENNILSWLEKPWVGKDKQESLLRLFAGLGLIDKLKSYDICKGNFNEKTITKHTTMKDIFYNQECELIYLKDKGNKSDLTMICKENEKKILVTSSKNRENEKNEGIGKYDIRDIHSIYVTNYGNDYELVYCICTKDRETFVKKVKNCEKCNEDIKEKIQKETTIIIDWNDLNEAYNRFKMYFCEIALNNIIDSNKTALCLRMHQHLGVLKTLRMKNCGKDKILWGHIQRSGKSYIIGGCIIEDSKDKYECNYLVITTAPNETIQQQRKAFDCIQLKDFNIIVLNGKNKKPDLTKKNIIICSKQFLQTKISKGHDKNKHSDVKTKSIAWLKKLSFDMRFLDESHNGGTTELAKKTLEFYGQQAFTVQITATYSKPIIDYNISKDCWILWDLEDIKLRKNIMNEDSIIRLVEKHGDCIKDIISKYSQDNIISEYSKYPELYYLTDEISQDTVTEILNHTKDNHYGWSTDASFLLKQSRKDGETYVIEEFQNEKETLKLWYRIFGQEHKLGIPDKDFPDKSTFIKRIEEICKNPTINSRFIGEGDFQNEPMIIMAFLPQNNIDKISKATKKLLERKNVIPDYLIININSKTTNNPKKSIEEARIKAKNSEKKGVLVLSGKQCSMAATIDNCDIVLLLNNIMGFDMISQMMFRCMTEGKNKKCGFVVDLNIHRVIQTFVKNASLIKPDSHPREAMKFILHERLINLNGDHWMPTFGNNVSNITALCKNVYELYSSYTENAVNYFINRLSLDSDVWTLTNEEKKVFNPIIINTKIKKESIDKLLQENDAEEKIKKGIEKTTVDNEDIDTLSEDEKKETQINYMDILKHILKHIIPLICLLTIHDKETSFVKMLELIENNDYVYNILIDQIKSWWGKSIDLTIIKELFNIYIKYMQNDKETTQIIRTIKELFMKNIKNNRELSILIDKYLIPQELEKKNYAEVSTPFKLRQEMLDKIPVEFWTSKKKVFEPCAGKGGFIVDIVDRFMNGLKEAIPDEKLRHKTIVEECLYFSDINSTNIFICKLLIDPYNEYKLNYNEGNTLEINIKKKWNIEGFEAVIMNSPYNSYGNTGTGNTIWQDFTKASLNKFLKQNGYLLCVHPPGWRKPNTERGKFYGLYELMTQKNQMIYLSIHGIKDGQQTFNCGTRYDWYLIQKKSQYTTTIVNDENTNTVDIDTSIFKWLPNYDIDTVKHLLAKENDNKCNIIQSMSAYEPRKKWMSKIQTDEFKYPCIHLTPKSGIRYMYSNVNDRGHFGVSKVIFGDSGIYNPVIDMEGHYGMTQHAMAIKIDSQEEAIQLSKALTSEKMKTLIDSCLFSSFAIDWNIFKDMKKDFWKEFI